MPGPSSTPESRKDPEEDAASVGRQFRALEEALDKSRLLIEVGRSEHLRSLRSESGVNLASADRWMNNGWAAEHLLRQSERHLTGEGVAQAVRWTFDQAYYSAYACLQAVTVACNEPYTGDEAVRRRFTDRVRAGQYPPSVSLIADGADNEVQLLRVDASGRAHPADLRDSASNAVPDGAAGAALGGLFRETRRFFLNGRSAADGAPLRPTTVLDLLYRRRCDARSKQALSRDDALVDDAGLHRSLVHVVSYLNMVHEVWIAALAGIDAVKAMVGATAPYDFVRRRAALARRVID